LFMQDGAQCPPGKFVFKKNDFCVMSCRFHFVF
jgi:hypothetical protein